MTAPLPPENQLSRLQREFLNPPDARREALKKSALQFEGIFMEQMLSAMDKTIDRSQSMLNGGYGEDVFRGMLNQHLGQMCADRPGGGGFGLAPVIYRQMAAVLDASDKAPQGLKPLDRRG